MKLKKLFVLFLIFTPFFTFAVDWIPIVPDCGGSGCNFCHLLQLAENIKNFLIFTIAAPVVTLMFVYAGFLYLSAKEGNITKAHTIFKNTVLGLVIMLASYLIVDLVLTTLANDEIKDFWKNGIICESPPVSTTSSSLSSNGIIVSNTGTGTSKTLSHNEAISQLTSKANIKSSVTSEGVQQILVDEIINMKDECPNCNITITSTTGDSHVNNSVYTHENGYKVDLRYTDTNFNNYLRDSVIVGSNVASSFTSSGYVMYTIDYPDRIVKILDEGTNPNGAHWDVQVIPK